MLASLILLGLGLLAVGGVLNALWPRRHFLLVVASWAAAWVTVELAAHLLVLNGLAAAGLVALGALEHTVGVAGLVLLVAAEAVGAVMAWRATRTVVTTRDVVAELDPEPDAPRVPRSHIVLPFLMFRDRRVRHDRGIVYARRGSFPLKLDVYAPRERPPGPLPAVIEVHGGAWVTGNRKWQGIPLLNHLAANGWVGFNINYRLSPLATWPDQAIDVKEAIAWVREHAEEHGVDPSFVALTGGSAGGHITAFTALTADDRSLQPGFESADTSVAAAIPFYGVYDFVDPDSIQVPALRWLLERYVFKALRSDEPERWRAASPLHRVHAGAPPFFVIHGDRDSLVPVEDARRFVEALREVSREPVLYAEMRGAQHAFDVVPSFRTAPVIEAIERFLHTLRSRAPTTREEEAELVSAVAEG